MKSWFFQKSSRVRRVLNLWPPFLFSGIRITELSDDYRHCRVELKNWPGTRNANGSQFGGSLFAMTDPVYSLMLMGPARQPLLYLGQIRPHRFHPPRPQQNICGMRHQR